MRERSTALGFCPVAVSLNNVMDLRVTWIWGETYLLAEALSAFTLDSGRKGSNQNISELYSFVHIQSNIALKLGQLAGMTKEMNKRRCFIFALKCVVYMLESLRHSPLLTRCRNGHPSPLCIWSQNCLQNKQTPWPLVRERTIPTDRPPLVDEI
jgi:hypothetical protein